jgi:3'(2'), 5'-bisphosphate nucleotidase
VLGVVSAPAQRVTYWGIARGGAFRCARGAAARAIHTAPPQRPVRVLGSRSHASAQTAEYLARLGPHVMSGVGSSLKFCLLAEGEADLYVRFGATSEWDTAAGQAVLEAAGGHVTRMDGHRMRYNCRESLINGDFVAFSDAKVLPS